MKSINAVKSDVVHDLRTDYTWNRVGKLVNSGARALPQASAQYVVDKFPIVGWLPRYNPRWIVNDFIAGLTLGLMLIPQGLSYAKIATIPVEYGLMSSWLPGSIYAFMGTSKDLSTGPTSLIGLLTSEIIKGIGNEYTPSEIASAVAMVMGIYGMAIGFLKLGFLLEFISLPILNGFISAVAITIILNQLDTLLGEPNVGDGTATQIHDIFNQLPQANGYTCAIGFTGILFLTILDQCGKRWGKKNKIVWFMSVTRAFLCLVLFTGVSYGVNHHRGAKSNFLFEVVAVKANGIEKPKMPQTALLNKLFSRSIAIFIGAAVEHTAIARAFGVKNNYTTDQSQELAYMGITNFFNSFFHSMGVGGAMSRTAVNSACNVKSPLSGFVTTAVVLVCIFELVGTLYWIPKATLAAIIITAVWPLISSPTVFYRYWKTSLADFISSMIAFWVCLFVSTEYGIGISVAFNIVYILLRQVFARVHSVSAENFHNESQLSASIESARGMPTSVPSDTHIFRFSESIFFPNSFGAKSKILDVVETFHSPAYSSRHGEEAERTWSVVTEKRVARLRRKANITDASRLPPIRVVVLDFTKVNHTDITAVTHLRNLYNELKKYGGDGIELRFVGMTPYIRSRFERAGWPIVDGKVDNIFNVNRADSDSTSQADVTNIDKSATKHFRDVNSAVHARRRADSDDSQTSAENLNVGEKEGEKPRISEKENV